MSFDRRTLAAIFALLLLAAGAFFFVRGRTAEAQFVTQPVQRGDVAMTVGATGTVEAVTSVQVGSQVSGTVLSLNADFNSRVHKGDVVARLDPSLFDARLEQAQANLVSARANVEKSRAALEDAKSKYARAQELAKEGLLPTSDLETARSTFQGAAAQVRASDAAVTQAVASVNQARVDMEHTVIRSPIDGVVVARNVDVGQTVAASLQAPVLFVIAKNLDDVRVRASVDEADVGRVREGLPVTFHVDAFPSDPVEGRVEQVRLQPRVEQNVVTYDVVIAAQNRGQRLMPGMTATISIVIDEKKDVLTAPAAALQFRPPGEGRGGSREGARGTGESRTRTVAQGAEPAPAGDRGGARGGASGADRGGSAGAGRGAGGGGWPGRGTRGGTGAPDGTGATDATGAPSATGTGGERRMVWVLSAEGKPEPRRIEIGLSDGRNVEVRSGLTEGDRVITGLETSGAPGAPAAQRSPGASNNPFAPGPPQRRTR